MAGLVKQAYHSDGSPKHVHMGGWRRQPRDSRDYRLQIPHGFMAVPASWDNRVFQAAVEDQGDLGSCTANLFAGMVESNEVRAGRKLVGLAAHVGDTAPIAAVSDVAVSPAGIITFKTTVTPPAPIPPVPPPTPAPTPAKLVQVSRLFEYYATRKIEGTTGEDSGATIRDTIKAGYTYGVADEASWPYDISKFAVNPPQVIWTAAAGHKVTSYHSITDGDLATMKAAIVQGFVVGFGFDVYSYFMSATMASKAMLSMPTSAESLQGGHAVGLVGYDDSMGPFSDGTKGGFLVRNSWGTSWGLGGYFWMSYSYVGSTRLCSDFWIVQSSPV